MYHSTPSSSPYVFMALFAGTLDHVEWKSGIRCDGTAMSVYNIIAVAMVGICTGIFNGLLASAGYIAPSIDAAGSTVAAVQPDGVQNVITFAFVGLEIITGIVLAALLVFLNVEKTVEYKQADILERQKARCLAEDREWIEPENRPVPKALNEKDRRRWEAERKAGEAYHARIQAELGKTGR